MGKRIYLIQLYKFDDKVSLTVLSLMYPINSFYGYSPFDLELFIYKSDSKKQETKIVPTHIYIMTQSMLPIFTN